MLVHDKPIWLLIDWVVLNILWKAHVKDIGQGVCGYNHACLFECMIYPLLPMQKNYSITIYIWYGGLTSLSIFKNSRWHPWWPPFFKIFWNMHRIIPALLILSCYTSIYMFLRLWKPKINIRKQLMQWILIKSKMANKMAIIRKHDMYIIIISELWVISMYDGLMGVLDGQMMSQFSNWCVMSS